MAEKNWVTGVNKNPTDMGCNSIYNDSRGRPWINSYTLDIPLYPPTKDAGHHKDHDIFVANPNLHKPSFATVTGRGATPKM